MTSYRSAASLLLQRLFLTIELMRGRNRLKFSASTPRDIGKIDLSRLLGARPTILEIGAHKGIDTIEFAIMYPKGSIWAFEPQIENFERLRKRVKGLSNVYPVPAAVSERTCVSVFHQSSGHNDASGSLLVASEMMFQLFPEMKFEESQISIVPTVCLDDFIEAAEITNIDLLWMDIQGAELSALKGTLRNLWRVRYVYLEVCVTPLYIGSPTYAGLKDFMGVHGFRVCEEFLPDESFGNVLFARC